MERNTDQDSQAHLEPSSKANADEEWLLRPSEDPLAGEPEAGESLPEVEYPQAAAGSSRENLSYLTCDRCGKTLGSGKSRLDALISASLKGMVTQLRAVGIWYETQHFCPKCGQEELRNKPKD
jgi:NADH pyrophosphatase NudC (nudix superfamily)